MKYFFLLLLVTPVIVLIWAVALRFVVEIYIETRDLIHRRRL